MKKYIAMLLVLAMVIGWIAIPPKHAHAEETTQVEGENSAAVEPLDSTEPEIEWTEYPETAFGYSISNDKATISRVKVSLEGYVALPATLDGYPVTKISQNAFEWKSGLNGIKIPDTVTEIGAWAFGNCENMDTLILGSGLEYIGMCAFNGCSSLTEVTIPASVTTIGNAAFLDCTVLRSITVEEENTAFSSDKAGVLFNKDKTTLIQAPIMIAGSYTVPESVEVLHDYAFNSCTELTEVILPAGLTYIGKETFWGCTFLRSATIPFGVTTIGEQAFYGCEQLESINLPYSITTIGDYAFAGCMMLASVTVPGSVTSLGWGIFKNCVMLNEVKIEEGITEIGQYFFQDCTALMEVTIPESVTWVDAYAFYNCDALITVFYPGSLERLTVITSEIYNDALLNANIVAPDPCADGHIAEIIPGKEPTATEPGLTEGWACANCGMILKPQEEIPPLAEPDDPAVSEPTAPTTAPTTESTEPSVPEADWEQYLVFELLGETWYIVVDCDDTISGALTIPATYDGLPVVNIEQGAFDNCEGLTSVVIPNSIGSVGREAFRGCTSLQTVTMDGVEDVNEYAFYDCVNLTSVSFGYSLKRICQYAFSGCEKLDVVYYNDTRMQWEGVPIESNNEPLLNANIVCLGEGVVEPGEPSAPESGWENGLYFVLNDDGQSYRVSGYEGEIVGELVIPATYNGLPVTMIDEGAFPNCYELTGVVLPESITVISYQAFVNCHNLQSVNLPEGLVAIAEDAFASCDLREIQIPASVVYIGAGAFNACPLDGIWVDENNPEFANDDKGVLFSKDMTFLKAVPYGLTGSYAIPDGVEVIGMSAFANTRLSQVTFPDSVEEIGYYAFNSCYLTEIVIGNGVTGIASCAFTNCQNLVAVTIPNSVAHFGDDVFGNSLNVTIYCYVGAYAAAYAAKYNIPISYLDTVTELSIATMPEKLIYPLDGHLKLNGLSLNATLEDGTQAVVTTGYTVSEYDFSTAGTKTITVSLGGLSVSFEVVVDDTLLEYPESDHPYEDNSNITWKFTYPGDAEMLQITFSEDTKTESCDYIYITDSEGNETSYSGDALSGKTITVPGKNFTIRLTSDGSVVYYGFAITSIVVLKPVGLEKLTFTLNEDGTGYILTDCDETAESYLEIPSEYEGLPVTAIGDNAFQNCAGLINVIIPEGVTGIGAGAFQYCSNLKNITIPVSITAIGDYAFVGCDNLTNVYYGGNRSQWEAIEMGENNGDAIEVKIHFSKVGCEHLYQEVEVLYEWGGEYCLDSKFQDVAVRCADCGENLGQKTITIPPTGHVPGESKIEEGNPASCNYAGQNWEVVYCERCGETLSRTLIEVPPTGHQNTYREHAHSEEASCTRKGYTAWSIICADCGDWLGQEIEETLPVGHVPGEPSVMNSQEATCQNDGYTMTAENCIYCGIMLSCEFEIIPATDHIPGDPIIENANPAYCTGNGSYQLAVCCQYCGLQLSCERVVVPATGHTPGEKELWEERSPDCLNTGFKRYIVRCANENCGAEIDMIKEYIPATGHTEVVIPGSAPTCDTSGWSDHIECSVCGAIVQSAQWIPMLGHTAGDPVIENETESAYDVVLYCVNCGMELDRWSEEIACPHTETFTTTSITIPATCTTHGEAYVMVICAACNEFQCDYTTEIPMLGHTPGDAVVENMTATSYDEVIYCEICGDELSRQTIQTACAHNNTATTTQITPATCVKPGVEITIVTCADCGEELSTSSSEIPATGIHTYSNDNDAVCNECYCIRQMVDQYEFINYRVVYSDSDTTHKNARVIIYKLGDRMVADPSDEKVLKTIDPSAETIWQVSSINNILLTDAGNYILLLKYNVGTATVSVPMVIRVTADPKLIIDKNNKLTVIDNNGANINHRVVVYYLGDKTVDNIYDEAVLKAIDSAPKTVWQKSDINKLTLTKGGNYVLHLCYNVGTGAKQTVAQTFTVASTPTLSINQNNMLVAADENAENKNHRVIVYYLGTKSVTDPFNETEVKNAAIKSWTVWGLTDINKLEILEGGKYVFHLCYNVGTAKRTVALEATLTERPTLSVSEDNKLVVQYSDASIKNPRVYIYNVGNKTVNNIYDETALNKIATPTQVWGLSSILRTQLAPGTYVIHLYYNVGSSAKSTVALKITIGY